ncbi:MAG: hypothetical protein KAW02_03825 [candidate division Zixibacteria bacterium]|nr:hypothetical protein [candidate division Zixibacteria bacterium]
MTKKLFVVLVVIAALLITFSFVIAAKKAPKGLLDRYEKAEYLDKQTATGFVKAPVEQQEASVLPGHRAKASLRSVEGTVVDVIPFDRKDYCDMTGTPAFFITNWIWGGEFYANFQEPYNYGCVDVFPFLVTTIGFELYAYSAVHVDIRGIVYDNDGTSCPLPGAELCTTPVYGFDIPSDGWWILTMDMVDECCVYEPYFAGVEILTSFGDPLPDAISGSDGMICQSYNDWGSGWADLVGTLGWPGMIMLYSFGYTRLQNDCVEEPVCCQFTDPDECSYLAPTECFAAGGTPAPDARYECIDNYCVLPWEGDTCTVELIYPATVCVLAGEAATYDVTVAFEGAQTDCYLATDPDPVCTDCDLSLFVPNPVTDPETQSTLTIQTDETTPVGTYPFEVTGYSGLKYTATLEVVDPSDQCEMKRDNEGWAYFWDGWVVGDMQLMYFDPDAQCCACGDDVYPFNVSDIKLLIYNHQGSAAFMDYIFHIYSSTGDPCDGPQQELLSWNVDDFSDWMTWTLFPLPEVLCVDGPFFFALEFNYDAGPILPCALWEGEAYLDMCSQWVFYGGEFVEWADMWTSPNGYMSIRALGTCADEECPVVCYMSQDQGNIAWFNSGFEEGDQIVKYYNPEDYCEPPVYPYNIEDLDFLFYEVGGAGSVPVVIHVYLECQDSCDGPGTEIFVSDPFEPDLYGTMAHVDFDEPICVYEPFYIGWEYLAGIPGSTPSPLFMDGTVEPAEYCHAWFYKVSAGAWIEHYDFWSTPDGVGYPLIRVSGSTNHPDCDPPSCDTTITKLGGGEYAAYYWRIPDAYGDDFFNERFEMPAAHGGRLEYFDIAFHEPRDFGTPNADFYVWLSDGMFPLDNNPPYQAIADFHMDYNDLTFYPGYTRVYTYSHGIEFGLGELFHIGYSQPQADIADSLAVLSDDGPIGSDRSSEWWGLWGTMLDDWGVGVDFMIDAYLCDFAIEGSTFTMKCSPALAFGTPEDVDADLYDVEIGSVIGYNLNVTLSLLSPPTGISATFNPNGVPAPFDADVLISIAAGVPYDDYPLTIQAVGADGQTRVCDVTLKVQPPYDEDVVEFHAGLQRTSTFGAIGNDVKDNFVWNGTNYLFDGTIISAVPAESRGLQRDHFALDVYNCEHVGFIPTQHLVKTDEPWCPGGGEYEEWYGEIAYSNFYTEEDVISCEHDSLFVIGLKYVDGTDFSIKIKIYYNPEGPDIPVLWASVFEDWDVGNAYDNWVGMDPDHNLIWQYDAADPSIVFGIMKCPFYDEPMHSMVGVNNAYYVWPNAGFCDSTGTPGYEFYGLDSLYALMTTPGYRMPTDINADSNDMSLLITGPPFQLNQGDKHIEIWIDFGRNLNDGMTWQQWYHKILRYVGFYRGDVNASDSLELPALDISDLVYLTSYLFRDGPAPLPFADQGDVDGKGPYGAFVCDELDHECPKENVTISDVVYLINYVFKGGPPPVDRIRFIEQCWTRPSLFLNSNWQ